jgi:hypothetical protein
MPNLLGDSENYVIRCYITILSLIMTYAKRVSLTSTNLSESTFSCCPTMFSLFESNFLGFASVGSCASSKTANKCIRYYTTFRNRSGDANSSTKVFLINPWFITGFVDAEGSFIIKLSKSGSSRTG